ncbi:MAG: hypothetical protein ACI91O_001428 [Candidatus Poriferisodalaceae bacterium]|jgi:hypothetical protein
MDSAELKKVRKIALRLPEVTERFSHGAPSFLLRDKRPICYFHAADFASDGLVSVSRWRTGSLRSLTTSTLQRAAGTTSPR